MCQFLSQKMNFRKTSYVSEKENIVPMINIVFLLLIFFLITSSLVPRPGEIIERPFGLSDSNVEDPNYLFITSNSEIMYRGQSGEIAWNLIKEARSEIRRVVWPTNNETTQTTLVVLVMVFIFSLILWGLDSLLSWLVSSLIG